MYESEVGVVSCIAEAEIAIVSGDSREINRCRGRVALELIELGQKMALLREVERRLIRTQTSGSPNVLVSPLGLHADA